MNKTPQDPDESDSEEESSDDQDSGTDYDQDSDSDSGADDDEDSDENQDSDDNEDSDDFENTDESDDEPDFHVLPPPKSGTLDSAIETSARVLVTMIRTQLENFSVSMSHHLMPE